LNTQTAIDSALIHYRVACHPVRLLADCAAHTQLPQPLITPFSMLPEDVKRSLAGKEVLDFGLNVQDKQFSFQDQFCSVPSSLVMAYAFAVVTSGLARKIYLAGFDGYLGEDARNTEMNDIIKCYLEHSDSLSLIALTPTRYDVPSVSIYGL
jgi:4-hydroxy 2-oxovalerate aldolase